MSDASFLQAHGSSRGGEGTYLATEGDGVHGTSSAVSGSLFVQTPPLKPRVLVTVEIVDDGVVFWVGCGFMLRSTTSPVSFYKVGAIEILALSQGMCVILRM